MLETLEHLHGRGICHRDIKLENVMLETEPGSKAIRTKIVDFGFATNYTTDFATVKFEVGTTEYMAPETLTRGVSHDHSVDVWALGVLTYLMLAQEHPFVNKADGRVNRAMIKNRDPDYSPLLHYSAGAENFVRAALTRDQAKRPSAKKLLNHPWLATTSPITGDVVGASAEQATTFYDIAAKLELA